MPLEPNELLQQLYDQAGEPPTTGDNTPQMNHIPGAETPQMITDPINALGGTAPNPNANYGNPNFSSSFPAPKLMTLDEMIDVISRKTELATGGKLSSLERAREQMQLDGQKQLDTVTRGYESARQNLTDDVNLAQQQGAQTMTRRGIYDSGLAMKLGSQIASKGIKMGLNLGEQQAQQLADISEFLFLSSKHNMEQIQEIMGEKGLMAASMLDDMRMEQQQRGDVLAQQEFENWLASQAAQLDEYWRQENFDAGRADQEWNQWFNNEQLRLTTEQNEWDRVFSMNKWEAESALQVMLANHQISQAEFNNALALDDFNLRKWLYQAQNRAPAQTSYSQPAAPTASEGGMWWNLF